jgi:hypothetical protein
MRERARNPGVETLGFRDHYGFLSIEERSIMTRNGKFILAGVSAAAIGLAAAGAVAHRGGQWGHGHGGGFRGGPGLMGMAGFAGPGFGKICRGDGAEMADHMMVRIEHKVKPAGEQQAAFQDLKAAAKTAAEKLRSACPKEETAEAGKEPPKLSPIERLDRTQAQLEASLEALKAVRPAAEKFYASLSDDQKSKLNERGGRGWKHWDRRHGGKDTDKDGADGEQAPAPQPN